MTIRPWVIHSLLACALLATAIAYWSGLSGPFVFDDESNFSILKPWLEGLAGGWQTVFGNDSGPGGRPLAIASFMLSAWMGGITPFTFKAGNLFLHLVNGLLVYALARRLAPRDRVYAPYAPLVALVLASMWLLHPLLVSTVLYAVQRMAMLSTTFVLIGMLAYFHGRKKADKGHQRIALAWLFLVVPACTLLAAAAKENGLLLPLICAILEFCYFRPSEGDKRPAVIRAFLWLGVVFPILAGLALFACKPALVLAGYQNRDFTLMQRLLTESRVLWDYVASSLLPYGPRMSLYRDDYLVSTGLLSPPTTLLAVTGWAVAIVLAWRTRRTLPAVAAGLGIFLVGHLVESTVIPLLLYFEHRNYLPVFGVLWAVGAIVVSAASRLAGHMNNPRMVFGSGLSLLVIGFALATHARALVWANADTLLAAQLKASPGSRWVRMDLGLTALKKNPIDFVDARAQYVALQALPDPISRQIGAQGLVVVDCAMDGHVTPDKVDAMFAQPGKPIAPDQVQMIELVSGLLLRSPCDGLSSQDFAQRLSQWLDTTPTSESARAKQKLRFLAAQHYIAAGDLTEALNQAKTSWNGGARELPLAAMIIDIHIALGNHKQAWILLNEAAARIQPSDKRATEIFDELRAKLNSATLK